MPQPNSDKENYTIDEMMGRLKKRQEAEPELVTRADGSHALKVRKRKRRTDQTAHRQSGDKKRAQIVRIAAGVSVLTLAALAAGIGILYVNSAGYRDALSGKLEVSSGAEAEMRQFRMNPVAANANAATLRWPSGNILEKLEMVGVSARISPSAFFGKTFGGEEMVAETGKLSLKAADPDGPVRHVPRPDDGLPVRFSRYAMPSLDIHFGEFGGLSKTEASLFPGAAAGQAEMRFNGGVLQLIGWPSMSLDRCYIKARNGELRIQNMRFEIPGSEKQASGGYIDFSGSFSPTGAARAHTLSAKLGNFPISHLVGGDLGRFFAGKVDSLEIPDSNFLSFDPASPESARLELTVTGAADSRVDLSGFRFLQMLAVAFNDRWYEAPVFDDEATMLVARTGQNTEISGLNLVKRGRMVVRGELTNGEGGAIRGKLRIGIPETAVAASGDKKLARMFGPVREGYRWVDLQISGTGAVPEDDFRTIYMDTAAGEPSAPGQSPPRDSFEGLIEGE